MVSVKLASFVYKSYRESQLDAASSLDRGIAVANAATGTMSDAGWRAAGWESQVEQVQELLGWYNRITKYLDPRIPVLAAAIATGGFLQVTGAVGVKVGLTALAVSPRAGATGVVAGGAVFSLGFAIQYGVYQYGGELLFQPSGRLR